MSAKHDDPPKPSTEFVEARGELLGALESGGSGDRRLDAEAAYGDAVEAHIVQPLLKLALASPDPLVRCLGVELAEVSGALARMRPRILHVVCQGSSSKELTDYLTLSKRSAHLTDQIRRLQGGFI
jgi:hypothetical protein